MKSWYTIRARASGTEVLIYDEIGAYGVTAKGFLAELGALPNDAALDLRLNSPGGSVFDAVAIFNALKRHAGEVTVWIDGIAASAAPWVVRLCRAATSRSIERLRKLGSHQRLGTSFLLGLCRDSYKVG